MWLFDHFLCVCGPVIGLPSTERICFVEADPWKNSWFLCRVISGPVSAWYQTSVSQLMCCFAVHSGSYTLFHILSLLDNDSQLLASPPCFEITIDAFLLILSISQSILQDRTSHHDWLPNTPLLTEWHILALISFDTKFSSLPNNWWRHTLLILLITSWSVVLTIWHG